MHDVLVHYLEVNFPEIAEQLAHARARDPSDEERAAAAERLRELIRRLRRGAEGASPEAAAPVVVEQVFEAPPTEGPTAQPAILEPTPEAPPSAAAPEAPAAPPPAATELQAARLVPEQMAGPLQTILLAAAQQALDLL